MSTSLSNLGVVLTDGTVIYSNTTFSFASGTKMLFVQSAAPTGWTKDVANTDTMLRVTSGSTGGSSGGSRTFSSALTSKSISGGSSTGSSSGSTSSATTLSVSQINSHRHSGIPSYSTSTSNISASGDPGAAPDDILQSGVGYTGGGGSHTHSYGESHSHSWSYSGDSINFAVKYVDVITAAKD